MSKPTSDQPIGSNPIKHLGLGAIFAAILASLYLLFYFLQSERPNPVSGSLGWLGWFDQGWYFTSANSLSNLRFEDTHHWYPIGYPLLGAFFFKLLGPHLFLIVNLTSFLAFFTFFYRTFREYLGSWLTFLTFLVALLIPVEIQVPHSVRFPIATQFIIPWNSIPVAAIYAYLIYHSLPLSPPVTSAKSGVIGALVGALFFLRPVDLVALLPLSIAFLSKLSHQTSHRREALWAVSGFYATFGPLLLLSLYIHGSLNSDYVQTSKNIGLDFSRVLERFALLFIDATPIFGTKENPLIELQPWLPLALPFFTSWAYLDRRVGGTIVSTALLSLFTYLGYNDLLPTNLFKFNVIHYFVWLLPYLLAGAVVSMLIAVRQPKKLLIPACITLAFNFFCYGMRLEIERMPGTEALE